MVWTLVEPGVAIVAASLATIRPLLRAMRVCGFDSTGRSAGKSGSKMRSGTDKSVHNNQGGALDMETHCTGGGEGQVELGDVHSDDGARPKGHLRNFSRPQRGEEDEDAGRRGGFKTEVYVGDTGRVEAREVPCSLRRSPPVAYRDEDEEALTSVSSLDNTAQSQHSGRVGLGPGGL